MQRQILVILLLLLAPLTGSLKEVWAQPDPFGNKDNIDPDEAPNYWGLNFGGDIQLFKTGKIRTFDPRIAMGTEFGGKWFAIPVMYSAGESIHKISLKPRAHYFFSLGKGAYENVYFVPGAGPVLSYLYLNRNSGQLTSHTFEAGFQIAGMGVYRLDEGYIALGINFEYNFWAMERASGNSETATYSSFVSTPVIQFGLNF